MGRHVRVRSGLWFGAFPRKSSTHAFRAFFHHHPGEMAVGSSPCPPASLLSLYVCPPLGPHPVRVTGRRPTLQAFTCPVVTANESRLSPVPEGWTFPLGDRYGCPAEERWAVRDLRVSICGSWLAVLGRVRWAGRRGGVQRSPRRPDVVDLLVTDVIMPLMGERTRRHTRAGAFARRPLSLFTSATTKRKYCTKGSSEGD